MLIFPVKSQCLFCFYFYQRIFTRKICQILKVVFSRQITDTSGGSEERRVRTLYACVGEHESELSFEPNQLITDGNYYRHYDTYHKGTLSRLFSSRHSFAHSLDRHRQRPHQLIVKAKNRLQNPLNLNIMNIFKKVKFIGF